MSGVDVMAVLGALNLADPDQRPDLTRARAAVAELIAAAQAHHAAFGVDVPYIERRDARRKLGAAIARCRGGAA